MATDTLTLDGNAMAGLLCEVFGAEVTPGQRVCPSCGTRSAVGAHRAYRGAGIVLRCPACSEVALRIAVRDDGYSVHLTGTWRLELPR